jgi:type II secretion system protein I
MKHRIPNQTRRSSASGFTLLEVLVATAILGTAVAALFSLLSGALSNARRLEGPEQAVLLARSKMNELLAASDQGRNSSALRLDEPMHGNWEDRGNGQFRWEAAAYRAAPEEAAAGQPILVRVVLQAFWKLDENDAERRMVFETYQLWQQPVRSTP